MSKTLMRIPYTGRLPDALIIPATANTLRTATEALAEFLSTPAANPSRKTGIRHNGPPRTVLLTGAGISVASGLADYRGENGTYRQNQSYRPVYYHEFTASHEWRKRYWARSFLGFPGLEKSTPNAAHLAVAELGKKGHASSVITQNVDSFHPKVGGLPIIELHGYLRSLVCLSCKNLMPRASFQDWLKRLNPAWDTFLRDLLKTGALDTENPEERRKKGYRTNPDGDADVPGAPYTTFRYPACPTCLKRPPTLPDGSKARVEVDKDGGWSQNSNAGILKPNVIMFGESIPDEVKAAAEQAIEGASKILVIGSSLATYSAWRLVKRAFDEGMPIGILNMGGTRKEEAWYQGLETATDAKQGIRISFPAEIILPEVLKIL